MWAPARMDAVTAAACGEFCGGRVGRARNDFRDGPTMIGRSSAASWPGGRSISEFCSLRFAEPKAGVDHESRGVDAGESGAMDGRR